MSYHSSTATHIALAILAIVGALIIVMFLVIPMLNIGAPVPVYIAPTSSIADIEVRVLWPSNFSGAEGVVANLIPKDNPAMLANISWYDTGMRAISDTDGWLSFQNVMASVDDEFVLSLLNGQSEVVTVVKIYDGGDYGDWPRHLVMPSTIYLNL